MEFKADSSVNQVLKNGFYVAIRFGIQILTGILFIPFLIKQYGTGTYGLIALAGFLTQYVGFISGCIGSSIGRFLNISLNKNNWQEANEMFSTALAANIALVLLQIPFFAWGIWNLEWVIDFPAEMSTDFRILVACNVAIFLSSMIIGVLQTPIQAANRIDISIRLGVFWQLVNLVALYFLITKFGAKLWIIGAVSLGTTFCGYCTTYYLYRRFARKLVFKKRDVSWKWIKPVVNMAGWSVVAGLGQILFQKTDVWIINRFVDIKLAGVCAALLIWPNFVQQIAKNVSSLLQPVVMIDYSRGHYQRIRDTVLLGSDLFSILSMFVCGGVMLLGGWLLELWMDETYRQYEWYLILMLLHFPLTLAREAVWLVFPAYNKMEYLGISNLVSGIINIALSIALVFMGYGLPGVIIATGISLILQRTLFLSYFAAKLIKVKYWQFARIYLPGLILIVVVGIQVLLFENPKFMFTGILCLVMGSASLIWMYLHDSNLQRLIRAVLKKRKSLG